MKLRLTFYILSLFVVILVASTNANAQVAAYLSSGKLIAAVKTGDRKMHVLGCMVGASAYRNQVLVSASPITPMGQQFKVNIAQLNSAACSAHGYPVSSAIYFNFPTNTSARTTIWVHGTEWYLANIYGHFGNRYFFAGSIGAQ